MAGAYMLDTGMNSVVVKTTEQSHATSVRNRPEPSNREELESFVESTTKSELQCSEQRREQAKVELLKFKFDQALTNFRGAKEMLKTFDETGQND